MEFNHKLKESTFTEDLIASTSVASFGSMKGDLTLLSPIVPVNGPTEYHTTVLIESYTK